MSGPLLLAALAALILGALVLEHLAKRHSGRALVWRWLSGHTLDGVHRTNAGWFTPADRVLHPTGKASRWHHRPRAHRAAVRSAATAAALAAAWGLAGHRAATVRGLAAVAAVAAAWAAWATWRAVADFRHVRSNVRPLHHALGPALGVPAVTRPGGWLDIPRGYQKQQDAQITVRLPRHFSGGADAKRAVEQTVCERLALEAPGVQWHLAGSEPRVQFTVQIPPPAKVRYADVAQLMAQAPEHAPLLGLGRAARPVNADLDADSPHVLVSAGSGGGKSVTTRTMSAQVLRNGGVLLVLDIKRLSHAWARGLPNVRYCRSVAEIHDALLWLRAELDHRNELADNGADVDGNTDHVDVGPRIVLLAEEMNATINRLAAYYRSIKSSSDPNISPAIDALGDAIFMGRQVRVNVFAVAQLLTARTVGGPEARESFGLRILARYTVNAWRILVPEIWPMPRSSRHAGRVQVAVGGVARECQVAYLTAKEARELATSGAVATFPAEGAPVSAANVSVLADRRQAVSLSQAVAQGVVSLELAALRSARARDPEFPAARGTGTDGAKLYDPASLRAWEANRPRAKTAAAAAGE